MTRRLKLLTGLVDVHDPSPANAAALAQRRARLGMLYALLLASALCALSLAIAPPATQIGSLAPASAVFYGKLLVVLVFATLAVCVVGLYFIGRYVLLLKSPHRPADVAG